MNSRDLLVRQRWLAGVAMGALGLLTAGAVNAQDAAVSTAPADRSAPPAPIDPREAKLEQLQSEVEELSAQIGDLKAQMSSGLKDVRATQAAAQASAPKISFPDGRPTFSSADGNFKVALRTVVQFDAAHYDVDPRTASNNLSSGTDFRRARFGFDATLYHDWNLGFLGEFGGRGVESAVLNQAYLEYAGFKSKGAAVRLRVGAWATPAGLEDATSNAEGVFVERPAVAEMVRNFAGGDGRAGAGAFINGAHWYLSGVLTGDVAGPLTSAEFGEQEGYLARVAIDPLHGRDYDVHLGANITGVIKPANTAAVAPVAEAVRLRERPESSVDDNSTRLVDTGAIAASGLTAYGLEAGASFKSLYLAGEWFKIDVDRTGSTAGFNPSFDGWYVQGSWTLTGERHVWTPSSGGFRGIKPNHLFDPGAGGWGAWEIAGRYSVLDLNDQAGLGGTPTPLGGVRGGVQKITSAGINWYPNPVVRFLFDFQNVNVDRLSATGASIGENVKIYTVRSQFAF